MKRKVLITIAIILAIAVVAGLLGIAIIINKRAGGKAGDDVKIGAAQGKNADEAKEALDNIMRLIIEGNAGDVPVIGADGNVVTGIENSGVAAMIISKLTYEIGDASVNGDTAEVQLKITAPDAVTICREALEKTEGQDEQAVMTAIEEALNRETEKVDFDITAKLRYAENQWCLMTDYDFSNAISGGMVDEYQKVRQEIVDAWTKGVSEQ